MILRILKNACCEEIRGSLDQKRITSVTAMCMMLCSPAGTRWVPMEIRSTSTTELLIARSPWLTPAFAHYLSGSMPMEASSAASDRRIYEGVVSCDPICFRLSAPSSQSCVHYQTPHVQDLLRLWTGIRLAKPAVVSKKQLLAGRSLGADAPSEAICCHLKGNIQTLGVQRALGRPLKESG